jgi:hypothetical protein
MLTIFMPEGFDQFFAQSPFWAVLMIVLMGISIVGAVAWVILRALRKPENKESKKNW